MRHGAHLGAPCESEVAPWCDEADAARMRRWSGQRDGARLRAAARPKFRPKITYYFAKKGIMKKIIIIEDERLLAEELAEVLESLRPDWQIIARLDSVKSAIDFFAAAPAFDLIFSDIQLGDGQSFQIFEKIPPAAPVIFCTAYHQYALEAFRNNGIDYVLKPFDNEAIAKALAHYELLSQQLNSATKNIDYQKVVRDIAQPSTAPITSILVRFKDKIIPVQVTDIALVFIHHGQAMLMDFSGHRYMLNETLDELEQILGARFYRIDRQHIVQRRTIIDVSQYFGRRLALNLKIEFADTLSIRKEKASDFLDWLTHTV
jgi:DNA-binding LytR/AlgR family response regulator